MADLLLVTVRPDGTAGDERGRLHFDGEAITATGDAAAGLMETLRRHVRLPDPRLWQLLTDEGWSNGHLMVTPA